MKKISFTYIRGGTSRAVFFLKENLPKDTTQWNNIFKNALGLPRDMKEPKGALGKHLPTSKIAVISSSEHSGFDVDYHFFQMNDNTGIADDRGTCGNMSSAVGTFAADHGLVQVKDGENTVKVYNVNTGKLFLSTFIVKNEISVVLGDTILPGLTETGSPIVLDFRYPGGGYSGKLFPTGHKTDKINCESYGEKKVTIIDCVNPIVIVKAEDVGMTGRELKNDEINNDSMKILQMIRGKVAVLLKLVEKWEEAAILSTYIPHISVVSKATDYVTANGENIYKSDMDFCARSIFTGLHPTYPAGAAIATAAAACISDTIIEKECTQNNIQTKSMIRKFTIGHPCGCFPVTITVNGEEIESGRIVRTARVIFDGELYCEQM